MRLLQLQNIGNGGRLGNHLFTIASCIGLALRHGYTPRINQDWKYRADFPNIPAEWYGPILRAPIFRESCYKYDINIDAYLHANVSLGNNITIQGYFQTPLYWKDYEDKIRHYLTPKGAEPGTRDAVAIHYRRGDYVGNSNYVNLESAYYLMGVTILGITNPYKTKFIARSDDPELITNVFNQTSGTELQDFIDLANCKEHIISNSTFAWWAAYLSGGKVVAPREWFAGELAKRCSTKDLLPEKWILI